MQKTEKTQNVLKVSISCLASPQWCVAAGKQYRCTGMLSDNVLLCCVSVALESIGCLGQQRTKDEVQYLAEAQPSALFG